MSRSFIPFQDENLHHFQTKQFFSRESAQFAYEKYFKDINVNTHKSQFQVKMLLIWTLVNQEIMDTEHFLASTKGENHLFRISSGKKEGDLHRKASILSSLTDEIKRIQELVSKWEGCEKIDQIDEMLATRIMVDTMQKLDRMILDEKLMELEDSPQTLECDAYFFTSKVIDVLMVFALCFFIYLPLSLLYIPSRICGCFKDGKNSVKDVLAQYIGWIASAFFCLILLIPGVLVVATQSFCLIKLAQEDSESTQTTRSFLEKIMNVLFTVFFFFLSMKEVSAAVQVIAHICTVIKVTLTEKDDDLKYVAKNISNNQTENNTNRTLMNEENFERNLTSRDKFKMVIFIFLSVIRFLPQLVQIFFCFWFCSINMIMINQIQTSTDLIQNFAALAILLEFDNLVMNFLRCIRFKSVYDTFYKWFDPETDSEAQRRLSVENLEKMVAKFEKYREEEDLVLDKTTFLNEELKRIIKILKAIDENLQVARTNDFLDDLKSWNIDNLIQNIPVFADNYFKNRNNEIEKIIGKPEFKVPEKYLVGEDADLFDFLGFLIIAAGISFVVFLSY